MVVVVVVSVIVVVVVVVCLCGCGCGYNSYTFVCVFAMQRFVVKARPHVRCNELDNSPRSPPLFISLLVGVYIYEVRAGLGLAVGCGFGVL